MALDVAHPGRNDGYSDHRLAFRCGDPAGDHAAPDQGKYHMIAQTVVSLTISLGFRIGWLDIFPGLIDADRVDARRQTAEPEIAVLVGSNRGLMAGVISTVSGFDL